MSPVKVAFFQAMAVTNLGSRSSILYYVLICRSTPCYFYMRIQFTRNWQFITKSHLEWNVKQNFIDLSIIWKCIGKTIVVFPQRERERRPSAAHGVPDAAPAKKRTFGHNFWRWRRTRVGLISKLCSFLRAVQRYRSRRASFSSFFFFRPCWGVGDACYYQPPEYICLRDNFWWSRRTRVGLILKLCSFLRAVQRY